MGGARYMLRWTMFGLRLSKHRSRHQATHPLSRTLMQAGNIQFMQTADAGGFFEVTASRAADISVHQYSVIQRSCALICDESMTLQEWEGYSDCAQQLGASRQSYVRIALQHLLTRRSSPAKEPVNRISVHLAGISSC